MQTIVTVSEGGQGNASLTAYAPIFGGTTSTGAVQSGTVGTSGQALISKGAGSLPTFQTFRIPPSMTTYLSGSGTYNLKYAFTITSGSATVGATYTNNGITYTVFATVASATLVYMSGSNAPQTSGTLTKDSGTGDSTLTFSQANTPLQLNVIAFGGGGGGAGSGSGAGTGGTGGNTTLGTTVVVANGGTGGANNGTVGGAGGSSSLATGVLGIALTGGSGTAGYTSAMVGGYAQGGRGGGDGGGSGAGGSSATTGGAGVTNTGGGGGGAGGTATTTFGGAGGAAGGQVLQAIIISPATTYAYAIGAAGTAGTAGTAGSVGGGGGAGGMWISEIY